jgi:hypothetical protein
MVAAHFNKDISIASRHRTAAAQAQSLANAQKIAITVPFRDFGAELIVGVITGPQTLTFLAE